MDTQEHTYTNTHTRWPLCVWQQVDPKMYVLHKKLKAYEALGGPSEKVLKCLWSAHGMLPVWIQLEQPGNFLRASGGDIHQGWDTRPLTCSQEEDVQDVQFNTTKMTNMEPPIPASSWVLWLFPEHHTDTRCRHPTHIAFCRRKPKHTGREIQRALF